MKASLNTFIEQYTQPIEIGQVDLRTKPVAVIYNPASGKGRNIRLQIETKLAEL